MKTDYTAIPGKGLMSKRALELRMEYLSSIDDTMVSTLGSQRIDIAQIQNNIESYIGTVEIPLGLVGPLSLRTEDNSQEWIKTAVATTEGALIASMNRGAKAISQSGGFRAHVVHQKMLRSPLFVFHSMGDTVVFSRWIKKHFDTIKRETRKYSNHAELLEINCVVVGKVSHLRFIYATGDASGQNMTTSCTWHACLWIQEHFSDETGVEIINFVIEGNGASDKKVSYASILNGRGTHVISECFLTNEVIKKTLRTDADSMFQLYIHSMAMTRMDGMVGYNANVANAIAGIFASTGQDLACIHESSVGILQMDKTEAGIHLSLCLPNLVIGTVGGGTHLPVPSKVLELMDCKGSGKVGRFAKIIAGFALSLEVSTVAAIVSGQFANAHQKYGRNKPVNALLKSEFDACFVRKHLTYIKEEITAVETPRANVNEGGILMNLAKSASKKMIGFMELDVDLKSGKKLPVLVKSKALSDELYDGLHFMGTNLNANIAEELIACKENLEYKDSHLKEIAIYEALRRIGFENAPSLYGTVKDPSREVFMIFMERLQAEELLLFNSENHPTLWTDSLINKVISTINQVHSKFYDDTERAKLEHVKPFQVSKNLAFYESVLSFIRGEYEFLERDEVFVQMQNTLDEWKMKIPDPIFPSTLIHNDFNPRNVAITGSEKVIIYDWELSSYDLPHRDIFEWLAFTLEQEEIERKLEAFMRHHFKLLKQDYLESYQWSDYLSDFKVAGESYLLSRLSFYMAGSTLVHYPFTLRVFNTTIEMLNTMKHLQ